MLNELFSQNAEKVGRELFPFPELAPKGSTDLGNVSHVVPTIGTFLGICELGVPIHSKEFTAAAVSEEAWKMLLDGAKIMAFVAIDTLAVPGKMDEIKAAFVPDS